MPTSKDTAPFHVIEELVTADDQNEAEDFNNLDNDQDDEEYDERCFINPDEVTEECFMPLGVVVQSGQATVEFWQDTSDNQLIATVKHDGYSSTEPGATYRVDAIPHRLGMAVYRHLQKLRHNLEPDLDSAVYNWLNESDQDEWLVIRRNNQPV